jgi:hypothetical protein
MSGAYGSLISRRWFRTYAANLARLETAFGQEIDAYLVRYFTAVDYQALDATGLVVVGDLVGEGSAQEQAVVGDTPNLAARLQALAEPGQIVLAPRRAHGKPAMPIPQDALSRGSIPKICPRSSPPITAG